MHVDEEPLEASGAPRLVVQISGQQSLFLRGCEGYPPLGFHELGGGAPLGIATGPLAIHDRDLSQSTRGRLIGSNIAEPKHSVSLKAELCMIDQGTGRTYLGSPGRWESVCLVCSECRGEWIAVA